MYKYILKHIWLLSLGITIILMLIANFTSNQIYAKASFYGMLITLIIGLGIFVKKHLKDSDDVNNYN